MKVQVLRPNGTLYNQSVDNIGIYMVQHEAWNQKLLKIVTDIYFDRNEFYVGDSINIKNFTFTSDEDQELRRLKLYLNRTEGHEVLQIGKGNAEGFHNTFYIKAPGRTDAEIGRFEPDTDVLTALNVYNRISNKEPCMDSDDDECCCQDPSLMPKRTSLKSGVIINMTLQNVITFSVETIEGDVSVLGTSAVGCGA
jgi:hypothetical protein